MPRKNKNQEQPVRGDLIRRAFDQLDVLRQAFKEILIEDIQKEGIILDSDHSYELKEIEKRLRELLQLPVRRGEVTPVEHQGDAGEAGTSHALPCRYVRVLPIAYAVDPADLWIFVTAKVCPMNEACPGCYPSELRALIDDCSSTAGPIEQTERR